MLILRPIAETDIESLVDLARQLDSLNLPSDREFLERRIRASLRSFAQQLDDWRDGIYVFVLVDADGTETELPAAGRWELKAGQGFYLDKAGGGGYGDPKKRDRATIERDLEEGYVTEAAAKKDYGA